MVCRCNYINCNYIYYWNKVKQCISRMCNFRMGARSRTDYCCIIFNAGKHLENDCIGLGNIRSCIDSDGCLCI